MISNDSKLIITTYQEQTDNPKSKLPQNLESQNPESQASTSCESSVPLVAILEEAREVLPFRRREVSFWLRGRQNSGSPLLFLSDPRFVPALPDLGGITCLENH
ncbi:hypothetical protein QJS04_geneDACA022191 [Acorus gramineus]|uniref:Uncharacterized protein n=1 Tax=Acorus gramineus TaxID=55184 RepID=A0AAV9BF15_ACOGR|nr:hypothetical protein QJS04_geneDACA022191 [Acorus gramineus]